MSSVTETLIKRVKDLSSLNNTLYEKNNGYVKELFDLRQELRQYKLELAKYKEECEDRYWYIQYLEERIALQNGAPFDEDD